MTFDPAHFKKLLAHWDNDNPGERANAVKATINYVTDCGLKMTEALELSFGNAEELARLQKELQETNAATEEYIESAEAKIARLEAQGGGSLARLWESAPFRLFLVTFLSALHLIITGPYDEALIASGIFSLCSAVVGLMWIWKIFKQLGFGRLIVKIALYSVPGLLVIGILPSHLVARNAWLGLVFLGIGYGLAISPLSEQLALRLERSLGR